MGYQLNIDNPKTFNEKLQWLKLYNRKPEYTRMVDKYEVKQFVEERIGRGYTIPTLGVWDFFDEIDFDKLPERFVLKCTHDSGSIVIVDDKKNFDKEKAERTLNRALDMNFFWIGREWPYKNVKRKIIAEPYLCDSFGRELMDYKLFCFQGKVKMIEVDFDRFTNHKRNLYNRDWEYMPFRMMYPTVPEQIIEKPNRLSEMIAIAEKLSSAIPHVRIDFYIIDDKPIVGEMTFFPDCGIGAFEPAEWDEKLGDWIILPTTNKEK
ncbi:MAG: glycosyl transferase [Lachnospiraceae bacterium]|nr:glycosyl transferase [Lachnospiraceae bacterium]